MRSPQIIKKEDPAFVKAGQLRKEITMKKLIAVVFATLLTSFAGSAWAAFTSVQKKAQSARATTVGTSTVAFSIALKNTSDQGGADQTGDLTWSSINPANTAWAISDRCLVLTSTINILTGGGVQVYTDNLNPLTGYPKFMDLTPAISTDSNSNPGGLVLATGTASSYTVPLAWSIKSSSLPVTTNVNLPTTNIAAADPNTGLTGAVAGNRYQWLYMQDRNTPSMPDSNTTAFGNGLDYSRLIDLRGIHYASANADLSPAFGGGLGYHKSYVYFESNFQTALPNVNYATNIWLEAFTE